MNKYLGKLAPIALATGLMMSAGAGIASAASSPVYLHFNNSHCYQGGTVTEINRLTVTPRGGTVNNVNGNTAYIRAQLRTRDHAVGSLECTRYVWGHRPYKYNVRVSEYFYPRYAGQHFYL